MEKSRKQLKERKNRAKKVRGVKKVIWQFPLPIPALIIGFFLASTIKLLIPYVQTKAGDAAKKK